MKTVLSRACLGLLCAQGVNLDWETECATITSALALSLAYDRMNKSKGSESTSPDQFTGEVTINFVDSDHRYGSSSVPRK